MATALAGPVALAGARSAEELRLLTPVEPPARSGETVRSTDHGTMTPTEIAEDEASPEAETES
eukprot:9256729-Alexandrium_andersonii.AAC.1